MSYDSPISVEVFLQRCRSYVGTPFVHQGRLPGPHGGLDCVGLILAALDVVGMTTDTYAEMPDEEALVDGLRQYATEAVWPIPGSVIRVVPPKQKHAVHLVVVDHNDRWIHALRRRGVVSTVNRLWPIADVWLPKGVVGWQF